jgi:gentisate 1,2-dioxygenase
VTHAPAHSPKYHYSGAATRRLLSALPAGPDGAHTVRYTNPATGGAVMPALDCYAVRLPRGQTTRPKRTTCNMICLVVSGSGRSTVGEHTFDWSQHDVFSIPALEPSRATWRKDGRREPVRRLRQVGVRAGSISCVRNCNKPARKNLR